MLKGPPGYCQKTFPGISSGVWIYLLEIIWRILANQDIYKGLPRVFLKQSIYVLKSSVDSQRILARSSYESFQQSILEESGVLPGG